MEEVGHVREFPGSVREFPGSIRELSGGLREFPGSVHELPDSIQENNRVLVLSMYGKVATYFRRFPPDPAETVLILSVFPFDLNAQRTETGGNTLSFHFIPTTPCPLLPPTTPIHYSYPLLYTYYTHYQLIPT